MNDKELKKDYERSYYQLNPDKVCEKNKNWYDRNKKLISAKRKIKRKFVKLLLENNLGVDLDDFNIVLQLKIDKCQPN